MKRIAAVRIRNGQALGGARIEGSTDELQPTPAVDHRQTWDQEIWPDCLD